jgi:hypothetical protein
MSINITSLSFYDEFTGDLGSANPEYLMGNVGDRITAKISYSVNWQSQGISVVTNATNKTITRSDNGSFISDGFTKGDTFRFFDVQNSTVIGYFTIESLTDKQIIVTTAISTNSYNNVDLNGTTTLTSFEYKYNLIENNSAINFKNIVDSENEVTFNATGWGATGTAAVNMSVKGRSNADLLANAAGTITFPTIQPISITYSNRIYKQNYTILHTFVIPEYLAGQQTFLEDGQPFAPSYFLSTNSLKFICDINGRYENTSPEAPQKLAPITFPKGNVGYFNEFLNGGTPEYSLTSIVFTDVLTGLVVDEVDFNRTTDVVITLDSTSGNFVPVGTPYVITHKYLPNDTTDYVNTTTNYNQNFKQDRRKKLSGAATSNGEQYGTDLQVITNVTTTYYSANSLAFNYRIDNSAAIKTFLAAKNSDNRNFLIFVTPQHDTVTTLKSTDRNAVMCYQGSYIYNQTDATLFVVNGQTNFYDFPNDFNNATSAYVGYEGDSVLTRTQFKVLKTDADLQFIALQIRAEKTGEDPVILEQKIIEVADTLVDCTGVKDVDFSENREYKVGTTQTNEIYVKRLPSMDTSTYAYYEVQYPFKLRYETWRTLDTDVACFPNPKNNWSRYSTQTSGWSTTFNVIAGVEKISTEFVTYYKHSSTLNIYPRSQNTYTTDVVLTNSSGVNTSNQILLDENTTVTVTMTGDFATFPSFPTGSTTYYGFISLDNNSVGGVSYQDITSTEYTKSDTSVWVNNTVTMTIVDTSQIVLTNDIDYTKLDNQSLYTISSKIGFKGLSGLLQQENLFNILTEDGQGIIIT